MRTIFDEMAKVAAFAKALTIPGWMDENELKWLAKEASQSRAVLEIGVYRGRSSVVLAAHTPGTLTCVDRWGTSDPTLQIQMAKDPRGWAGVKDDFFANMAPYDNFLYLEMGPRTGVYDFVWLDGDHDTPAVQHDLDAYMPLLAPGGRMAGHDYSRPEVKAAVLSRYPAARIERPCGSIWAVMR